MGVSCWAFEVGSSWLARGDGIRPAGFVCRVCVCYLEGCVILTVTEREHTCNECGRGSSFTVISTSGSKYMDNVHANTEAVPFDFESAEALKTHLTHLTQVIEHQLPARYGADGTCGAAQLALEGFTGGYARVYRAKLASSFALLREFKECFSNAARNMETYIKAAREEERIRREITAWEKLNKRKQNAFHSKHAGPWYEQTGEDNPDSKLEIPPRPMPSHPPHFEVYTPRPVADPFTGAQGNSVSSGVSQSALGQFAEANSSAQGTQHLNTRAAIASGGSTVSIVPHNAYQHRQVTLSMNAELDQVQLRVASTYAQFRSNTSWGTFNADSLIAALHTWIEDVDADVHWLGKLAQTMFDVASRGYLEEPAIEHHEELSGPGAKAQVSLDINLLNELMHDDIPMHHLLQVPGASITGVNISSGYANDPVNVATGNFIESEVDLRSRVNSVLRLERTYNSVLAALPNTPHGAFGKGWSSMLDSRLEQNSDSISWHTADGRELVFERDANSASGYARTPNAPYWLEKVTDSALDATPTHNVDSASAPFEEDTEGQEALYRTLYSVVSNTVKSAHRLLPSSFDVAESPEPSYYWSVTNHSGSRYFYAPSGELVAFMEGHPSSAIVALYNRGPKANADGESVAQRPSALIQPLSAQGIVVSYDAQDFVSGASLVNFREGSSEEHSSAQVESQLNDVRYIYNSAGVLCEVQRPDGTRRYEQTEDNLIHRVWNETGYCEVENSYDADGRIVAQKTEHGRNISYRYEHGLMTVIEDSGTGEHANIWRSNEHGQLVSLVAGDGSRQSMRYNSYGYRTYICERDGSVTHRSYDERARLVSENTPEGAVHRYTWDEYDRMIAHRIMNKNRRAGILAETRYTYSQNPLDPNPLTITRNGGDTTYLEWDNAGHCTAVADESGFKQHFTYNDRGQLLSSTDSSGAQTQYSYDAAGNLSSVTNPLGNTQYFEWDASGRLSTVVDAMGARWGLSYAEAAQNATPTSEQHLTALTDPEGNITTFEYSAGHLSAVIDPMGNRTSVERDTWGNVISMTDAAEAKTHYEYDELSQLVAIIDPCGARTEYEYSLTGDLSRIVDATGVALSITHSRSHGEYSMRVEGASGNYAVVTDALGRVVSASNSLMTMVPGLGPGGSLRSNSSLAGLASAGKQPSERPAGPWASWSLVQPELRVPTILGSRDNVSRGDSALTASHLPSVMTMFENRQDMAALFGVPVPKLNMPDASILLNSSSDSSAQAGYNTHGQIAQISSADGGVASFEYDAQGRMSRSISAAGRETFFEYDAAGRCTSQKTLKKTSELDADEGYLETIFTYDLAGRLLEKTIRDSADTSTASLRLVQYTYDAAGRRIKEDTGEKVTCYSYTSRGLIARIEDSVEGTRSFSYDAAGRLVSVEDALGGTSRCEYDALARPLRWITPAGIVTSYEWDAAGRLLREERSGTSFTVESAADSLVRTFSYDAAGRLLTMNDGERIRSFEYDYACGGVLRSVTVDGEVQGTFEYSLMSGRGSQQGTLKVSVNDAKAEHIYEYSASGRLLSRTRVPHSDMSMKRISSTVSIADHTTGVLRVPDANQRTLHALQAFKQRGEYTLNYTYDADGVLVMSSNPYGSVRWMRDGAGRVRHTQSKDVFARIREMEFTHASCGALTSMSTDDTHAMWELDPVKNIPVGYKVERNGARGAGNGAATMSMFAASVERDTSSRVAVCTLEDAENNSEVRTMKYRYDASGALISVSDGVQERTWTYENGMMVAEALYKRNCEQGNNALLLERAFSHNSVGLLSAVSEAQYGAYGTVQNRSRTEYFYNAAGERVREVTTDELTGQRRERALGWDAMGQVNAIRQGDEEWLLHHDMTGELASVYTSTTVDVPGASTPLAWDAVSSTPMVLGVGGMSAGSVLENMSSAEELGYGLGWSMSSNPWESDVVAVPTVPGLGMVSAGPVASSVNVAGLDFMGFRVADAGVHRFVSTDALSSVPGIVHGMDVNSFVGWNPISLADPWGLRPMSVREFRDYQVKSTESSNSILAIGVTAAKLLAFPILAVLTALYNSAYGVLTINQYRDNERPKIRDLNVQRQYGHSGDIPDVPPRDIHELAQRMNSVNDNPYVKEMEKSQENAGYSSVQIDVYKNEITGEKVAYVYIPGTDFDNMSKQGELGSIGNNLGLAGNKSNKSIDDLSPYHRMVEEAMRKAKLGDMDRVVMVGHSQGGAVAYSLANNKEFNSKYKVSNVVTYGAPTANLERQQEDLKNHFNYVAVVNNVDLVPSLTPFRGSDPANRVHIVESDKADPGMDSHGMNIYVDATQRYVGSGYGDDEGVNIDSQAYSSQQEVSGQEEGTGMYTGRNTSRSTPFSRALRENWRW
ncbi:type IV secretion protein Rhs [Rothia sp. HMSC065B04]|nr:type IV secretion protein Rhs [Rothia sp. HMSC065B04]